MTSSTEPMIVVATAVSIARSASAAKSIAAPASDFSDRPTEALVEHVAGALPVEHGGPLGRIGRDPEVAQRGDHRGLLAACSAALDPRRPMGVHEGAHHRQRECPGQQDAVAEASGPGDPGGPLQPPSSTVYVELPGVAFELADERPQAGDPLATGNALAVELDIAVAHGDAEVGRPSKRRPISRAAAATRSGR